MKSNPTKLTLTFEEKEDSEGFLCVHVAWEIQESGSKAMDLCAHSIKEIVYAELKEAGLINPTEEDQGEKHAIH